MSPKRRMNKLKLVVRTYNGLLYKNKWSRATSINVYNSQQHKYEGRKEVAKKYIHYYILYINLKIMQFVTSARKYTKGFKCICNVFFLKLSCEYLVIWYFYMPEKLDNIKIYWFKLREPAQLRMRFGNLGS